MKHSFAISFLILFASANFVFSGTTGKIAGLITDSETGMPLPGVNVMLVGSSFGAATNIDGYFVILNIPPGLHTLKATMMGYAPYEVRDLRVNIDLTTKADMSLKTVVLAGEAVIVVAERPIIQRDISGSQSNLSSADIEALPVVSVASVVGMEAGVRGLSIRGGGSSQVAFMVNGFTLRDERTNQPYTAISYTAVDEIKIQTGGFNAEFGNIRSGVINVVTKEGKMDNYHFGFLSRYSAASQKYFGQSPMHPNSYWIRPYVDDEVAWTGTDGWDEYTQLQYPEFEGWNSISAKSLIGDGPALTPEAAQQVFLWEHRRELDITKPDYDADMSFGGPVPFVARSLGNLRFFASYRKTQSVYIVPLSDDAYRDYSAQLKLTSDIKPGMKLTIDGLFGRQTGVNSSRSGGPGLFSGSWGIAGELSRGPKYIDGRMYGTHYWCPSTITRNSLGAKLSHVITPNTYYEVTLHRIANNYDTNPGTRRNISQLYQFGNDYFVDEAPFGWQPFPSTGIVGLRMGVGMGNSRDTSKVTTYTTKFDLTTQFNRYNNFKAGVEFIYTDNNVNYGLVDSVLQGSNNQSRWHTFPVRAAVYVQDKIEFKAMIATLGLRFDYSDGGGSWFDYENPWDDAFSAANFMAIDTLLDKTPTKKIYDISPRVGISFPITVNSKLYFNYGHFRQMPLPENLYLIRRSSLTNALSRLANPNNPLPKTVAYELGYEHNIFNKFLVRIAGYYKDSNDQSRLVRYVNLKNTVSYTVTQPYSYQDTRGFEFTVRKNRGNWFMGFFNYTYEVTTSGYFGFGTYYENKSQQRQYETETRSHYQAKPIPRPFARLNVDFFTPRDFGPEILGMRPLEDWRINILGNWRSGVWGTWTGGGSIPGIVYNVQWRDFYNVDLRFSKSFNFGRAKFQLFMDVSNLFNYRYMASSIGFVDGNDYNAYMKSLHLPADIGDELSYGNISGSDQPGDYRKDDVAFQPIAPLYMAEQKLAGGKIPDPGVIYYDNSAQSYQNYINGEWVEVESGRLEKIIENKAYIDMPNQQFFTFLNPRDIFWGVKLSFDIRK